MGSEPLPQAPFDTVSLDRIPESLLHNQPQPVERQMIEGIVDTKVSRSRTSPFHSNTLVLLGYSQLFMGPKAVRISHMLRSPFWISLAVRSFFLGG